MTEERSYGELKLRGLMACRMQAQNATARAARVTRAARRPAARRHTARPCATWGDPADVRARDANAGRGGAAARGVVVGSCAPPLLVVRIARPWHLGFGQSQGPCCVCMRLVSLNRGDAATYPENQEWPFAEFSRELLDCCTDV